MNLKTKKIIATEIIIFFSSIILWIVLLFSLGYYNSILRSKVAHLQSEAYDRLTEINEIDNAIATEFDKEPYAFRVISRSDKYFLTDDSLFLYNQYRDSSITKTIYDGLVADGAITTRDYNWFNNALELTITDSRKYFHLKKEKLKLEKQRNDLLKKADELRDWSLGYYEPDKIPFRLGIFLAILIYPVRGIYLLIRWSVKILRTS